MIHVVLSILRANGKNGIAWDTWKSTLHQDLVHPPWSYSLSFFSDKSKSLSYQADVARYYMIQLTVVIRRHEWPCVGFARRSCALDGRCSNEWVTVWLTSTSSTSVVIIICDIICELKAIVQGKKDRIKLKSPLKREPFGDWTLRWVYLRCCTIYAVKSVTVNGRLHRAYPGRTSYN